MKILYASERPPFPFFLGGAARSAHYILSALTREYGVECCAVGAGHYDPAAWSYPDTNDFEVLGIKARIDGETNAALDCGFPVRVIDNYPQALADLIDRMQPDVVWSQMEGTKEIFDIASRKGVQGINFVRDAEFDADELAAIARLGVHFICNSQFLAGKVAEVTGKPASVIYPSLNASYGVQGDPDGYITMINAHPVKGVWTFLDIARRFPKERFLLLESWILGDDLLAELHTRLEQLPNVTFMRRVSDMSKIYQQSKLVLVPSRWEEAFGRVVIEAQSCGIPVIASERGGLPEAVGSGGLLVGKGGFMRGDYTQASAWVKPIKKVLGSKRVYDALAREAKTNADRDCFKASLSGRQFYDVCSELLIQRAS